MIVDLAAKLTAEIEPDWLDFGAAVDLRGPKAHLTNTADLYRYFDCTQAAEFLFACVPRTVEDDVP
ncbi:MAG: hypothetical protein AB7O67_23145 [Vicinamibacterales bacterium]